MRIVVVGATGNVGTSVLRSLGGEPEVASVLGVARRVPALDIAKTEWARADITRDDLTSLFRHADCVIHLAWLIQPSRDLQALARTNVEGTRRVLRAVADAGVPALVYASSIGAYSPGPKGALVDESWPATGIPTSFYSRHKALTERMLDVFETAHPERRVVRLRPALIFKREAASGIRRLFFGPLLPSALVRPRFIPLVPDIDRLRFQTVHSYDVGEAYRLAAISDVRGAFNIAADPVLGPHELARLLGARLVKVDEATVRGVTALTWRLRLQPSPEGWVDMAFQSPLMDTSRAMKDLGWTPHYSADFALTELLNGLRERAGFDTPPLRASTGGPARLKEIVTGVGTRSGG